MLKKENIKPGQTLRCKDTGELVSVISVKKGIEVDYFGNKYHIDDLSGWELQNPIIDNRIVDSKTFAARFKLFLKWIPKEWVHSQPYYLEEYRYMQHVANKLFDYQTATAVDDSEIKYLKNL